MMHGQKKHQILHITVGLRPKIVTEIPTVPTSKVGERMAIDTRLDTSVKASFTRKENK
jgi:hypothetical protein